MRLRRPLLPMTVMCAALLLPFPDYPQALACTYETSFNPFEQASDEEPPEGILAPEPIEVEVVEIVRGKGPEPYGCGGTVASSCDDGGSVMLELSRLPEEDEGLILETRGSLPQNFYAPPEPSQVFKTSVYLRWNDGATDEQEPIDFEIRVTAVDRWGNTSAPSAWVRVRHAGRE